MNPTRPPMTLWADPVETLDLMYLTIRALDPHSERQIHEEVLMDQLDLALAGIDEDENVQALQMFQHLTLLAQALVSELAIRHRPTAKAVRAYVDEHKFPHELC